MMLITLSHSAARSYALPTNLPTTPTVPPHADTFHAICTQWRGKQTAPTTRSFLVLQCFPFYSTMRTDLNLRQMGGERAG